LTAAELPPYLILASFWFLFCTSFVTLTGQNLIGFPAVMQLASLSRSPSTVDSGRGGRDEPAKFEAPISGRTKIELAVL
jgi:hypothetical protein